MASVQLPWQKAALKSTGGPPNLNKSAPCPPPSYIRIQNEGLTTAAKVQQPLAQIAAVRVPQSLPANIFATAPAPDGYHGQASQSQPVSKPWRKPTSLPSDDPNPSMPASIKSIGSFISQNLVVNKTEIPAAELQQVEVTNNSAVTSAPTPTPNSVKVAQIYSVVHPSSKATPFRVLPPIPIAKSPRAPPPSSGLPKIEQLRKSVFKKPDIKALLREIQEGTQLRHVICNDRSESLLRGRVLN